MTAARARWLEAAVLAAILLLAAVTRLPGLDARGRWDADQGHDMRVLRALALEGRVPLLGPRTSIGTFHHGAAYYYLLAPAAIVAQADPVAVTAELALLGVAGVAATWWLARLLGGPLAAAAAGLLAAVSPSGIDESTTIWNPNPIPVAAALAYAGAILARRTGRARWWLLAGVGAMLTMQLHVLGGVIVLPLAWAWAAELVRRRRDGVPLRGTLRGGAGALLVIAAGYLPLAIHELGHDFAESRAILEYLAAGGREAAGGVLDRVVTVGLRSIAWPIAGLITARTWASLSAVMILALLVAIAVLGPRRLAGAAAEVDVPAARWLAGSVGIAIMLLAVLAPSLAVITPGLPNDHYHAFLDPAVLALAGVGVARLAGAGRARLADPEDAAADGGDASPARRVPASTQAVVGGAVAIVLSVVLVAIAVTAWPPPVAPDGGWPLADAAAARVLATTGDGPVGLRGIPAFKSDDALRFPLERRSGRIQAAPIEGLPPPGNGTPDEPGAGELPGTGWAVVVCDPLFDEVVGAPCGGPAEDAWLAGSGRTDLVLADRFQAGPRRFVSVYAAGGR